jgi:hypothetical protein
MPGGIMKQTSLLLAFILFGIAAVCSGAVYTYFSDCEDLPLEPMPGFYYSDTLSGIVRTNDTMNIRTDRPCLTELISAADTIFCDGGPCGELPECAHYHAPYLAFPDQIDYLESMAARQGLVYYYPGYDFKIVLRNTEALVTRWLRGTPYDSTIAWPIYIGNYTVMFCHNDVYVSGFVSGRLTIASAGNIFIEDNLLYSGGGPAREPWTPPMQPQNCTDYLALVAAHDILIGNTLANGRDNSGLPNGEHGLLQPNQARTSVIVNGMLFAGGSVTFAQQSDADSGFVCDCSPDERGTFYLWGALYQRQRGYFWRAGMNGGTGYRPRFMLDPRLLTQLPPGICDYELPAPGSTDSVDFGTIVTDSTAFDTVRINTFNSGSLGAIYASAPFFAQRMAPFNGTSFCIPVRFAPTRAGQFFSVLQVQAAGLWVRIPLAGRAVQRHAVPPLTADVAPNPFNQTTTIRYALAEAGAVKLIVYDVLGRTVQVVDVPQAAAGSHQWRFDGGNLASGVYFVKLQTGTNILTTKLLLLK